MRTRIAVIAVVALVVAAPAAQWRVDRSIGGTPIAGAAGASQQITIGVSCRGSGHAVLLTLPGAAIFDNGAVEARWDDGSTDRYSSRIRTRRSWALRVSTAASSASSAA